MPNVTLSYFVPQKKVCLTKLTGIDTTDIEVGTQSIGILSSDRIGVGHSIVLRGITHLTTSPVSKMLFWNSTAIIHTRNSWYTMQLMGK